jgi:hypothetical protein
MALSGVLNTSAYQGRYLQFSWSAEQDIANNQSTINWTLKGAGGSGGWYEAAPFYVSIAGVKVFESSNRIQLWNGTQVASGSTVIQHDTDGKKDFTVNVKAAIYYYEYNCTGTDTFTLDDIPRAARIISARHFYDNENPKLTFNNAAGDAATVKVGLFWDSDGKDAFIPFETATAIERYGVKEFILTPEQQQTIWSRLANKQSEEIYYLIYTKIGDYENTSFVKRLVSIIDALPTLSPTAIDVNEKTIAATGDASRWVKGFSNVGYTFNAQAQKGASISRYRVKCGSKDIDNATASGTIEAVDSGDIRFYVHDSRGFTDNVTLNRTLVDYIDLTCNLSVSAILDTSSTSKATITIDGKWFNGEIKAGKANALVIEYRIKPERGEYGEWRTITPEINDNEYNIVYNVPDALDYRLAYTFQARARDDLYTAYETYKTSTEKTAKALPVFDWSNEDFNFNVPVNMPALTVNNEPLGAQKILHTDSGRFMNDGQSVTLTGANAISQQHTGYILVWYYYDNGLLAQQIQYTYIPKIAPVIKSTISLPIILATGDAGLKTLTIYDDGDSTTISGDDANSASPPASKFVLRYIVGY